MVSNMMPRDRAYYALMARKPASEILIMANDSLRRRRSYAREPINGKPVVRVFHRAGKELLALRVGRWVVSAHSWNNLTRKAALGPWKVFDKTVQLKKRWR